MRRSWTMMVLALLGCGDSGSDGGGGSTTVSATASTTTGAPAGSECLEKATQAECEAVGCVFVTGRLFDPVNDCLDTTPATACMPKVEHVPFGGAALYRRDVDEGRIVVEYAGMTPAPFGWVQCGWCAISDTPCDWCQCGE